MRKRFHNREVNIITKDLERIKLDYNFVKDQISKTKNKRELAQACNCGISKVIDFIKENGLYEYYCNQRNIKYDVTKENMRCSYCNSNRSVKNYKGIPYCKQHYNQMYRYGKIINDSIYEPNKYIFENDICKIVIKHHDEVFYGIIDISDYDIIKNYKWHLDGNHYVVTKGLETHKGKNIDISNVIFDSPDKYDHINHNRLDNRKINLRAVTCHQNAMNMGKKYTNSSGVTGITKQCKKYYDNPKWTSTITYNYKSIWLGCSESFDEMVLARLKAEQQYFGQYSPNYNPETNLIELSYLSHDDDTEKLIKMNLDGEVVFNDKIKEEI